MSDPATPRRPLLHPVLLLKKEPAKKPAPAGGKKESDIVTSRLARQRNSLAAEVASLRTSADDLNVFSNSVLLVSEMFDDSFAVSKSPSEMFRGQTETLIRGPANDGYLIETTVGELRGLEHRILTGQSVPMRCDISRVKTIRPYGAVDIYRGRTPESLWEDAPEYESGRAFYVWLSPFRDPDARADLLRELRGMRDAQLVLPTTPRILLQQDGGIGGTAVPDLTERQNSLAIVQREYLLSGRGSTLVEIPSLEAFEQLVASGSVFRIEPVRPLGSAAPGAGEEPRALPADILLQPVVGVVDGGCTARRYQKAEAWREPPFVDSSQADAKHGNQVASVVIHGHEWNNNLPLPELYCRVGIAQVIARADSLFRHNPARLVSYIDSVMTRHPETRVWNLSWNERAAADPIYVSWLGHNLSLLARKRSALFVISAGNVAGTSGDIIAPPADCEAALVVGARKFDSEGNPGDPCSQSLPGYGPEFQLVPQVTSYSPLRLLGGGVRRGTSFPTGLVSALAAHTFDNLRDPTPDMVRALIINRTDLDEYDTKLGWGTPSNDNMPWQCAPGTVTLAFRAALRAGTYYYWEGIPIPRELIKNGKLCGHVSLTTVHRPLCNSEGGPSYIATRVAAAIQYQNQKGATARLVGSKELDNTPELKAREEEYKWQPLRRECRDFAKNGGIRFGGGHMRLYARLYARNIAQFGYRVNADIPEIETVFVVTFSDGSNSANLYNSMAASLGTFVESAVLNQDIDVEQ